MPQSHIELVVASANLYPHDHPTISSNGIYIMGTPTSEMGFRFA
jgi:hypothetical protein